MEDTSNREIVITREYNAPRDLVWEAMTDPKHVVNWWGPRGFRSTIERHEFREGGVWQHEMVGPDGTKYPNKAIFKKIVKPEMIQFVNGGHREGGPGVGFEATWRFEALAPDRTRITARMVFPTPDQRDFVIKEFGAIEGGKQTLERLSEFLSKSQCEPFTISREFAAPRDLVWKAWTERDCLMQWFGPKGVTIPVAHLDFRPGGFFHYCMKMPDGKEMWGKFIYKEIEPPSRVLLVNSFSDKDGNVTRHPFAPQWPVQMLSETTLTEHAGKTTLSIKWLPFDATAEERKTFDDGRAGMTQGWTGTFEQLEAYLAKEK